MTETVITESSVAELSIEMPAKPVAFVHLRLHSEYSLVDGLVRIKPLVKRVADMNMPAVALTDVCNLFSLVKFYKAAQGAGLKPICGADFQVQSSIVDGTPYGVTLLVVNQQGYQNITQLISRAYQEGQVQGKPFLQRQWINELSEGLIVLCGRHSDVGQSLISGKHELAKELLDGWLQCFSNHLYFELTRTGRAEEEAFLHSAVKLASLSDCPVVATNDVRFLDSEQFDAHEARVCIGEGRVLDDPRRERRYSEQQYLRSPTEMMELFSDIPEALENTVEIAYRCNLDLKLGECFLPEYPIPEGMTTESFFEKLSYDGLDQRLEKILDKDIAD
ncbi:MAG: PHP domain-containing protein, partial [Porticoccus sp.]|nr:PHP domain-containing protein [Porticoccus sp.]